MPFGREGGGLVAELDDFEVALVASLVGQVNELLGAGLDTGPAEDPFSRWEGGFSAASTLDHSDPVVARLFPDAYAGDPGASAEYRRYTEDDLRRTRIAEGELVLADLAATAEGRRPLVVPVDHAEAWVRTVNGVRLSLAVRLGI